MVLGMASQLLVVAFAGLMVWAALSDARRLLIPNRIPVALAGLWVAYAVLRLLDGMPFGEVLLAFGFGLAAFALGTLLFTLRLMGGGDVKLLAAAMPWAGPGLAPSFLLVTLVAGGALGIALIVTRIARQFAPAVASGLPVPSARVVVADALKGVLPFGVAIASGGLFIAWRLLFGP